MNTRDDIASNLFQQMKKISPIDATLLGTPLFNQSAVVSFREKVDTMMKLVDRHTDLDAHYGYYILKNCFSIPNIPNVRLSTFIIAI